VRGFDNAANESDDIEAIAKKTFEHNGLSVTISSFTNIIGFGSGYFSSLNVIRSFGMWASFGIFMLFFNVLTLFGALLVYDGMRQKAG
jgi:predicted RND superfamily exporter protein